MMSATSADFDSLSKRSSSAAWPTMPWLVALTSIAAPAGTPKEIVAKLNAELRAIIAQPDVQKLLLTRGHLLADSLLPQDLTAFLATENERWGKVVRDAGLAGSL